MGGTRLAIAGAVMLTAACHAGHPEETHAGFAPASVQLMANRLLWQTQAERRSMWWIGYAEQIEIRTCMSSLGLDYRVVDPGPFPLDSWLSADALARVAPTGYGLFESATASSQLPTVPETPPDVRALEGDGARFHFVTSGGLVVTGPSDGCLARARGQLFGSPKNAAYVSIETQQLVRDLDRELKNNAQLATATKRWADCISKKGARSSTPQELLQMLGQKYSQSKFPQELHSQEVKLAGLDTVCDRSSDYRETLLAARDEALSRSARDVLTRLKSLYSLYTSAALRACTLVTRTQGARHCASPW